jgi:hypothetical protein
LPYYADYPTEPIGRGNPYSRCSYCKVPQPEINGDLKNHLEHCEYRRIKELEEEVELLKLEIQVMKLDFGY